MFVVVVIVVVDDRIQLPLPKKNNPQLFILVRPYVGLHCESLLSKRLQRKLVVLFSMIKWFPKKVKQIKFIDVIPDERLSAIKNIK